ncbi:MAG: hypothetical protein ACRDRU_12465 [Pseudonocardiaceae bacterium]|jgi:hypothetical protein
MNAESRREAVADLVYRRRPLIEAVTTLRQYPWDCEEELVELGPSVLRSVLTDFMAGSTSADDLEEWANAVEGRDDIAFVPSGAIDVIAALANPLLYEPLNQETARQLLHDVDALCVTGY